MVLQELNTLLVISIYGALLLLSFLTLANPLKVNKKANFWLGIFFLLWSTFWLDEILWLSLGRIPGLCHSVLFSFLQYFTPIVFYLSVLFFTNPDYRFRTTDVKYLVLPLIFLLVLIIQEVSGTRNSPTFQYLPAALILVQTLCYSVLSFVKIKQHQRKVLLFASSTDEINLKWLEKVIILILAISIIISLYNVIYRLSSLNLFMNIIFLVVIFMIAYYTIKQKEIFPPDKQLRSEIMAIREEKHSTEVKRKIISDEELSVLKARMNQIMIQQQPYLDSELNLIKLAGVIGITPHQLSYVINAGFHENFFQFINKYRVERAKELLVNAGMNHLSMLGIAFESGFNSKTSFNTTFKKFTRQTPSEFKKTLMKRVECKEAL